MITYKCLANVILVALFEAQSSYLNDLSLITVEEYIELSLYDNDDGECDNDDESVNITINMYP